MAVIALGLTSFVAIAGVATADAVDAEALLHTERRAGETAVIGVRIALSAGTADTEAVKAVALVIVETGYALDAAVIGLGTEWGVPFATGVVSQVAGDARVVHALTGVAITLRVFCTGHTFVSVVTFDTDG